MSDSCVFCRIIRREAPAYVVTEDERIIVFLSLENHPLVVPKQHIPDIYSLDETTGAAIMSATIAVSRAVKVGLACEGVYLTQANEPAAGQDVFHFHLHIYPRWRAVDFRRQQAMRASEAEQQVTVQKIKDCLQYS
jgi:histidine triad (HIT) family protein